MDRWTVGEQQESEEWLHEMLDDYEGEVLLILRHASASGALRRITPLIVRDECRSCETVGDVRYLGFNVARLMGLARNADEASVAVRGGGMDMGFHLMSGVSQRLYGDPYRLKHRWL
jgi:hypothetical protein